jgi:hypothetical protein
MDWNQGWLTPTLFGASIRAYVTLSAGLSKENSAEKNASTDDTKQSSGSLSHTLAALTRIAAELRLDGYIVSSSLI